MKKPIRVGVNFCENCNPHISQAGTFAQIKNKAAKILPVVEFVSFDSEDIDMMLVINSCHADCALETKKNIPEIVVSGESVNSNACSVDHIGDLVLLQILLWFVNLKFNESQTYKTASQTV